MIRSRADPARALSRGSVARARRDGRGLPRPGRRRARVRAPDRDQADPDRAPERRTRRADVRGRGADRGRPAPPQHRPDDRLRRVRQRGVPGLGARRRLRPAHPAQVPARTAALRHRGRDHRGGRDRPRCRARRVRRRRPLAPARPPRRVAFERAARYPRRGQGRRLRRREGAVAELSHGLEHAQRQGAVHGAGADPRRGDRSPRGRVRARRAALRGHHADAAVLRVVERRRDAPDPRRRGSGSGEPATGLSAGARGDREDGAVPRSGAAPSDRARARRRARPARPGEAVDALAHADRRARPRDPSARRGRAVRSDAARPAAGAVMTQPARGLDETVGPYRLIRAIGAGGSARIDLARIDRAYNFQRHVVIKRPLEHLRGDPVVAASLRRDARIGGRLAHPNLVAVLDAGTHGGYDYLALEYVQGTSLRDLMQSSVPAGQVRALPIEVALGIVIDIARGLHDAHELRDERGEPLGLVHRDISPGNVLLGLDGAVKVADFGIAKATRESTLSGSMHGTVTYMAPEQCRGHAFDRRADLWAVGVILYELATHQRLFWADNDVASLHRVLSGQIPRPRKLVPALPSGLEDIIMTAVAQDPAGRFATARELAAALETYAAI